MESGNDSSKDLAKQDPPVFMRGLMSESAAEAFAAMIHQKVGVLPANEGGPKVGTLTALAVLNEEFFGITTDGKVIDGLFPVRATGVATTPVVDAASSFLAALSDEQRRAVQFGVHDHEWRRWSQIDEIYDRQGVTWGQLDPAQKEAAQGLLAAGLSAKGLVLANDVRHLNLTAGELTNQIDQFNDVDYYFTVMGAPSSTEPWGWQLEGHHLVINYFVLGDQVVMTPTFWGSEPNSASTGTYAGTRVFDDERAAAFAMVNSLDEVQQKVAVLAVVKPAENNLRTGRNWPGRNGDNAIVDCEGIPGSELTREQREKLLALADLFVANVDEGHARVEMEQVREHLDETYFCWMGGTEADSAIYFRIQSPVTYIEFDNPPPGPVGRLLGWPHEAAADHTHIMVRTPNGNDYGKALLRHHLLKSPHHR